MYISRADGAGDTNQRQYVKLCLPIGTGPLRKTEHFGTLWSLGNSSSSPSFNYI